MKRLLTGLLLLLSVPAYAGTISIGTISADATPGGLNDNFQTIANVINGNIEGSTDGGTSVSNIKADTVFEINMADDANGRVRDSELFNITVDTISGGAVASQGTVVESGCVQATDSDLTADVSACTVYINGYRVTKSATSLTYLNNTTTYLWISQTGSYTQSTNPNSTIANSSLLSVVTTSGGAITGVTNLFTTRVPGLAISTNYRSGYRVSYDSATTVLVGAGTIEINNTILSKTTNTTLTLGTAGDWAGGSSLRAVNTYAYVGVDASGNVKMHTTAPTHDNYAVSTTAGKLRYATWSSTVYRVLGWFWMNSASSGTIDEGAIGNIKEGDVSNSIMSRDINVADVVTTSASFVDLLQTRFYSSGGRISISHSGNYANNAADRAIMSIISIDGVGYSESTANVVPIEAASNGKKAYMTGNGRTQPQLGQGPHTVVVRWRDASAAGSASAAEKSIIIEEQ